MKERDGMSGFVRTFTVDLAIGSPLLLLRGAKRGAKRAEPIAADR
jgi:hypothetical protein